MGLLEAYEEAREKLDKIVIGNGWKMEIQKDDYPITFTFQKIPHRYDNELPGQLKLTDTQKPEKPEVIPEIRLIFCEDTELEANIPDAIDNKFLNSLITATKEVHRLYLLHWFANKNRRFLAAWEPLWNICDGQWAHGLLPTNYKP